MENHKKFLSFVFILSLALLIIAPASMAIKRTFKVGRIPDWKCQRCHEDKELTGIAFDNTKVSMYVDQAVLKADVHKKALCVDCHIDLKRERHGEKLELSTCTKTCHEHEEQGRDWFELTHAQGMERKGMEVPLCQGCHTMGPHGRLAHKTPKKEDPTHRKQMIMACASCHEYWAKTYKNGFHGKFATISPVDMTIATCADCHGPHETLHHENPTSTLSKANVIKTCTPCHKGANLNFATYIAHPDPERKERVPEFLYYVSNFMGGFFWLIVIGGGIHSILWIIRGRRRRG